MRFSISVILLLCQTFSFGQFSLVQKKNKVGIKYASELIVKPKFDSVLILDEEIATAYKKKKIFFYNSTGNKIFQSKIGMAYPFHNQSAIIENKENKFGAINSDGKLFVDYHFTEKPVYFGNLLYGKIDYSNALYNRNGQLERSIDSIKRDENWILTYLFITERHTYSKTTIFGKTKQHTNITKYPYCNIYNDFTGKLLYEKIADYWTHGEFMIMSSLDERLLLIDSNETTIINGIYDLFSFNETLIYALKDSSVFPTPLDIYDYNGNVIRRDLSYVGDLKDGRYIFGIDSLQFIGNENGEQLSPLMSGFGESSEGYRLVYDGFSYTYMNDSTYEVMDARFPVIVEKHSSGSRTDYAGHVRKKFGNFKKRIQNFGRSIIGKSSIPLTTYVSPIYYKGWEDILEAGYPFINGFAKICTQGLIAEEAYINYENSNKFSNRWYNFIDSDGKILNKENYLEMLDFQDNKVLVKHDFEWMVIDSKGEKVNKYTYLEIRKLENGWFIVSKYHKMYYGLLDENYNVILLPKYDYLELRGNKCYEVTDEGSVIVRYTIPKTTESQK